MTNINKDNVKIINMINETHKKEIISTPALGVLALVSWGIFAALAYTWYWLVP